MEVLIVEGINDRKHIKKILAEDIEIVCTYGTLSEEKLETLILPIEEMDVYILVDADDAGKKLRKQLKRELPNATHLYIDPVYREVEATPFEYLAKVLQPYFNVNHFS